MHTKVITGSVNRRQFRLTTTGRGAKVLREKRISNKVYTPQGGTEKSALKGCLCPDFEGAYLRGK